jgi:DME family drug/metabolite transporter
MNDERIAGWQRHAAHPVVLIATGTALWGTIGVVVALLSTGGALDPLVIAVARLLLAAPVLWLWHRWAAGRWGAPTDRGQRWLYAAAALVFAAYHLTYFSAIPRIGLTAAVMLNICSGPLFTMLIARMWLGERLTARRVGWIVVAVTGSALLVGGAGAAATYDSFGVLLAVAAGLCYSTLVVVTRQLAARAHPVLIQAIVMTGAGAVLAAVAGWRGIVVPWGALPWPALVYLAAVPTLLSYVLYTRGLRTVPATTAATLTLLEPLVSTVVAVTWLGEQLTPLSWVGAAVLAGSLVAMNNEQ